MTDTEFRTTGYYAIYDGVEYSADAEDEGEVVLTAYGDGEPPLGFKPSQRPGVSGIKIVPRQSLESFVHVRTTCDWHGEGPFIVKAVVGTTLYLTYRGTNGKYLSEQPGGVRTDTGNYDTVLDVSEVENVREEITAK